MTQLFKSNNKNQNPIKQFLKNSEEKFFTYLNHQLTVKAETSFSSNVQRLSIFGLLTYVALSWESPEGYVSSKRGSNWGRGMQESLRRHWPPMRCDATPGRWRTEITRQYLCAESEGNRNGRRTPKGLNTLHEMKFVKSLSKQSAIPERKWFSENCRAQS